MAWSERVGTEGHKSREGLGFIFKILGLFFRSPKYGYDRFTLGKEAGLEEVEPALRVHLVAWCWRRTSQEGQS